MSEISRSPLGERFDAQFEAQLAECKSPGEITALMHRRAVEVGVEVPDQMDPTVLHATGVVVPDTLKKTVTVNGQSYEYTGSTPEELAAAESALYRTLLQKTPDPNAEPEPTPEEKLANEAEALRQQELEAAFRRGELNTQQYIEQSGYLDAFMTQRSWEQATNAFLRNHENWPGGEDLQTLMGNKLIQLGLQDDPSAEAMEQAYSELVREGAIPSVRAENEAAAVAAAKIGEAGSVEEIRAALGRSSSMFGSR